MKTAGTSRRPTGITYERYLHGYAEETMTKKLNTVEEVATVAVLLASVAGAGITSTANNVRAGTSPTDGRGRSPPTDPSSTSCGGGSTGWRASRR
jgi:hypothetical protein